MEARPQFQIKHQVTIQENMQQKVLVIEDSPTSMKVLCHLVNRAGLVPVAASSLTQAKQVFAGSYPEEYLCALVDYNLPDAQDGEAIDYTIQSFIPTVVITGRLDERTRDKVLAKDVVDYIPKENGQVYDYLSRLLQRLEKNKKIGVLVVDDSRLSRSTVTALLRRHNFNTYEAEDGQEGLTALRQHSDIKLVITDENMPNMTGVEMVAELRNTFSKEDLAVIGVSGRGSSALSARFIKSGANDYIGKPYCHEEFFCRVIQNIEHVENVAAIRKAANTDYLTGLPNRRHFFTRVHANLKLKPRAVMFALIDVDHFKTVNDNFGHDIGDIALKTIADTIKQHFKRYYVSRFGGEEFCVYIYNQESDKAVEMLEAFRKDVAETEIPAGTQFFSCTVSIGANAEFDGDISRALKASDENLYEAKQGGRNQTVATLPRG